MAPVVGLPVCLFLAFLAFRFARTKNDFNDLVLSTLALERGGGVGSIAYDHGSEAVFFSIIIRSIGYLDTVLTGS